MIAALAGRLARAPRAVLLAACAAAVALAAARAGETGAAAARAALAVAGLGAGAALLRRRSAAAQAPAPLAVVARAPLGRDTGVALLEVDGARVLVGFGPEGVRRLDVRGGDGSAP